MQIVVKIYSCYERTYFPIYKRILKLLYLNDLDSLNVSVEIEDTNESDEYRNIQSQRTVTDNSIYKGRIIRIYEDGILKHIVGLSNTNYDEDREYEFIIGKSNKKVSQYGVDNYHANTYLKQGINQIFKFYFENKETADLSFYLLDTDKGKNYPNNLFNVLSYRELETIGFKILNIDDINFNDYEDSCNSVINRRNMKFASFNKYLRDIAHISSRNSGNVPSFLQCDEIEKLDDDGNSSYMIEKYTYTFKSLSAQQYDSLLRCWCLKVLAEEENIPIEFKLGKQYFNFEAEQQSIAEELSQPVKEIFDLAQLNIEYTTNEEFMDEKRKADNTYLRYKQLNEIRNQPLFRNNIRKKGIPTECAICGEDDVNLLDAAHLWEVNQIKDVSLSEVNEFIRINNLRDIIELSSEFSGEFFYKKYFLANSGDNGVWLCKNHHKQFDLNYYCFDSEYGKVILKFDNPETALKFNEDLKKDRLAEEILTPLTQAFLSKRQLVFYA